MRTYSPELVPNVDRVQPPVDIEPEPAKPKDRKKRQSESVGRDIDAADVADNEAGYKHEFDADGHGMDLNDSEDHHADEAAYCAGAEAVFMDSDDDADDDDELARMLESLKPLGVNLLDARTYVASISTKPIA